MHLSVTDKYIDGSLCVDEGRPVRLSVVAYAHPLGMPARFYTGLVPAIMLARKLESVMVPVTVRVIDPTPIANYCNGWAGDRGWETSALVGRFLDRQGVSYFIDRCEEVGDEMCAILETLGQTLAQISDPTMAEIVARVRESGRMHGGQRGAEQALFYIAAHPFSWLDLYHPAVWKRSYASELAQHVNVMSKSEARFAMLRRALVGAHPELHSGLCPEDCYMTLCSTPCYIPLEGEPLLEALQSDGYEACLSRYQALRKRSSNHARALRDFEALAPFVTR